MAITALDRQRNSKVESILSSTFYFLKRKYKANMIKKSFIFINLRDQCKGVCNVILCIFCLIYFKISKEKHILWHSEAHMVYQYANTYHLIDTCSCPVFTYQCIILQWSKKEAIEQVNLLLVINEVKHCNQPTIKKYLLRGKMLIFREI